MNVTNRNVTVLVLVILLIVMTQLFRLDLIIGLNQTTSSEYYEYHADQAERLTASEREIGDKKTCLVICSQSDSPVLENITHILNLMQFELDTMTPEDHRDNYQSFDLIILVDAVDNVLFDYDGVLGYIQDGGHFLYLGNGSAGSKDLMRSKSNIFGITSWNSVMNTNTLHFNTEILTGLVEDLSFHVDDPDGPGIFQSLVVQLDEDCMVHVSGELDNPVIWERRKDGGNIMVMNTGNYAGKRIRGLLAGTISVFLGNMIYPVTQSSVIQITNLAIDDSLESEVLQKTYNRSYSQYIHDIWWPDMFSYMRKYKLKYTLAYIRSLDTNALDPFKEKTTVDSGLDVLIRSILSSGGEIAFQGYNNCPLRLDANDLLQGSGSSWPDGLVINEALQQTKVSFKNILPHYEFLSYIPPDQQFDLDHFGMLKQIYPELRIISSAYYEKAGFDQAVDDLARFNQEFGMDNRYGTAFPQVSSGTLSQDLDKFDLASVVTTHGIINHVVEADEITNVQKNLLWETLRKDYNDLFDNFSEKYTWLQQDSLAEAAEKLERSSSVDLYYSQDGDTIHLACDQFSEGVTLMLISTNKISSGQGCEVEKIDSIRYLIKLHEKLATVEVDPS